MEHVWNYEGYVGDVRGVDVAVRRLREKLEADPKNPAHIITEWGAGYRLSKFKGFFCLIMAAEIALLLLCQRPVSL